MLWLRAWLQETGGQYPGPRCRDGSMLRDLDLNRQNCNLQQPGDERAYNQIPLTNDHGDVFSRQNDLFDECGPGPGEGYEDFPPNQFFNNNNLPLPPSPVESEYFYDQYVDYPVNDTHLGNSLRINGTIASNSTTPYNDFNNNKFTQYNNQIFPERHPPSSPFTFFGMPIPSLTIGNIWGAGRSANNRAAGGVATTVGTSTGTNTRGKGRVQIFRPGDSELQVILNQSDNDIEDKKPFASSDRKPTVDTTSEKNLNNFYRPYFQTPFSQPPSEKGFQPMVPGMTSGGFIPVNGPNNNNFYSATPNNSKNWYSENEKYQERVPLVTETSNKPVVTTIGNIGDITKVSKRGQVQKTDIYTTNHVTTSIMPILSTLAPSILTVKQGFDHDKSGEYTNKAEIVTEVPKHHSSFDEISKFQHEDQRNQFKDQQNENSEYQSEEVEDSTRNLQNNDEHVMPVVETTNSNRDHEFDDNVDYAPRPSIPSYIQPQLYEHNASSSLSALIAPGSVVSENPQNVYQSPPSASAAAGKGKSTITKVFSPTAVTPEVEIFPRGTPRPPYPSPSTYNSYDSEYQPNQIYTQTVDENSPTEVPNWYFKNYNRTDSPAPILNYNQQSLDVNSYRGSGLRIRLSHILLVLISIVNCRNLC
jgi:hypothetical protein